MSKIFTVFGATGNQGGSVVNAILENAKLSKTYKIRAVTRDVNKPAAQALKSKGAEVVSANLDDRQSVMDVVKGSSVVFGVTNFWEKMSEEVEVQQGKNIADACKAAGVERFVWSSLPDVSRETHGKLTTVKHFDGKAHVEDYIREIGVPGTFVMPGMFMAAIAMRPNDQGGVNYASPFDADTKIPLLDPAADSGLFVAAALLHGQSTIGKRIAACGGYITPAQIAKDYEAVTGKKVNIIKLTWEQFGSVLPPPVREELIGNFQLVVDPGYYAGEPADVVDKSIEMVTSAGLRKPTTYKDFIEKTSGA